MAIDALVDSTQLDSDLSSVANAIRTKSGGSSQLAFPAGFVNEIGNIPSGGTTIEGHVELTNENEQYLIIPVDVSNANSFNVIAYIDRTGTIDYGIRADRVKVMPNGG